MSKEAALRAMREARYLERTTGAASSTTPARRVARPVQPSAPAVDAVAAAAAAEALCGHRSMNGRTCTREQGHAAKNHRYS